MEPGILIATAYWGPIPYYKSIAASNRIILEQFEHYPKQTYRNRCLIYGANGVLPLSIPVTKGKEIKINTKDVRIDNAVNWKKIHLKAIESAYGCAPFYIYYMDDVFPLYNRKFDFLFDFNQECMRTVLNILNYKPEIEETKAYFQTVPTGITDLREAYHPKKENPDVSYLMYRQVFEPKYGFQKNLSILDLIMNTGPEAGKYLKR